MRTQSIKQIRILVAVAATVIASNAWSSPAVSDSLAASAFESSKAAAVELAKAPAPCERGVTGCVPGTLLDKILNMLSIG